MPTYQNMSTQNSYLLKYAYSECVFNWKFVIKKCIYEKGKILTKSVKILKSQARFTNFCMVTLGFVFVYFMLCNFHISN